MSRLRCPVKCDPSRQDASGTVACRSSTLGGLVYGAVIEPAPPTVADLDRDGTVGIEDLGLLLGAWGSTDSSADLNCDGAVDSADLGLLLVDWGPAR